MVTLAKCDPFAQARMRSMLALPWSLVKTMGPGVNFPAAPPPLAEPVVLPL